MEKQLRLITRDKCRKNERGAALVMVLLITSLLLVAVIALLLETTMNTANVTDATAEEQAYYAAESGIQSVIRVLRGNPDTVPNPLINSLPSSNDNKIDYFKAVKLCTSNASCSCTTNLCDSTLDAETRLSRWLPYDTTFPDRVILGASTSATQPPYTPQSGFAYKIRVENPDNVGNTLTFNTVGRYIDTQLSSRTWTDGVNTLTVSYVQTNKTLDVSSGLAHTDFGKFVVTGTGTIPAKVRFAINVHLTHPYNTTKVIRGFIESGTITNTSSTVNIWYDSESFIVTGSTLTLAGGTSVEPLIEEPPGSKVFRGGYRVPLNSTAVNGGETLIIGSITAPEPIRLLIRSTGFGPRGAQKILEAIILKNYFNGLSAPSPLTLIGPPGTTSPTTSFVFNPGTSTGTKYDGKDVHLKAFLPPIGVTNNQNLDDVNHALTKPPPNKYNGSVVGYPSNIVDELPFWLQSTTNLNTTLNQLKEVALASGRYYGPGATQPSNGDYGNNSNATGITYIDGNLEFSQLGGGILVVTGNLIFKGGFNFNGLIIVTGQGGISRTGGGSGMLQGNMIVAPYLPNDLDKGFLAPRYDISGGGESSIIYNSNNVANGLGALNNFVKGVAEK